MQDLAHLPPADYDAVVSAVCRWRNKPKSYFRDVLRSGGLEGKFVQNVYPYTYMLKDYGPHGLRRIALNETSSLATPDNAARLMQQWGAFWNASSRIWIEKSPENVVQARFLQGLLEAPRRTTAFLFVLRHPLAWALAVDKWLVNKWNRRSTTAIRATAARIAMWLDVSQTMVDDLPHLRRALVVHAETLVRPIRMPNCCEAPPRRRSAPRAKLAKSKRSCVVDAEAPNATAHARRRELAAIRARHEARLNSFGYSLFLGDDAAASPGGDDRTPFGGLNSGLRFDRVQPRLRPYVVSS
ncbi:hypothetical protein M885DRAFT_496438 [Pelagophyceae sp. CCMP2097]|nr:hypothetical protein M885DRAFT_496438 [Pelagophyceae sp. CCMP2097]